MTMLILQTLLLVAIAYILGCIFGGLFHQWFAPAPKAAPAPIAAATTVASPRVTPPPPPPLPVAKPVAAKPKAATAKKRVSKPKPASKDDLKRIKGIGPQNEARLNAIGYTAFSQLAAWSKKEQADIGERLAFPGRIEREDWVKQAKVLAKGQDTTFSKRVDKGEVESSMASVAASDLSNKPSVIAKARSGTGDNLTLIDGVGTAIEKKLFALGIYHFDQIEKWTSENETWIGNEIGFPGRPERENWVKEAKILAAGGTTDHAKRVEAGKITTSRKSKSDES